MVLVGQTISSYIYVVQQFLLYAGMAVAVVLLVLGFLP
jgi:hypothetical protein